VSPLPSDSATVVLGGDLTIRGIAEAHATLLGAFAGDRAVVAEIDPSALADLTLVQLIESARRTAAERGLDFALAGPPRGALVDVLRRGGFLETPDSQAFWRMDPEI
jgi:hypothetical protein